MTEPSRLFDCIEMHLQSKAAHTLLAAKENGKWSEYNITVISQTINKLSAGLLKLGISCNDGTAEGRDKIAVIAKNRPEWVMLDIAVQQIGAVLTPVYPTISDSELEFIFQDAQVKIAFVNDAVLFEKVNKIKDKVPSLQAIYSFDETPGVKHWKEIFCNVENFLQQVKTISSAIKQEDLATIIYTSGTTGKPKGVMLSHKNIMSNVMDSMPYFPPGDHLKALSFLPLNHIFERMISYLYLYKGTGIYFAESIDTIGDNLKEVKPHLFTTVPRLLEKVYERIMQKGEELTGIKRKLFFWSHNLVLKFDVNKNLGWLYNMKLAVANKLVFSKWREALGNNIICIVSGGAACQVRLIRIFTAAKIPIMEGYGLTETSPVISVNRYQEEGRMFGTVGPLIRNVEVKLADDGEILCKGPNVMIGYYKRPDLTADSIENGWFKTGDIGTMINNEFLKITDRKKEIFKTSGGKYVAPLAIEMKLKESPYIENIMITGAGEKFVGALIIPAFLNIKEWCKQQNIDYISNEDAVQNEKILDLYKNEIEKYNSGFSHVEQIKKFRLLSHEWSVDGGELTPKLSLKRKIIMDKNSLDIQKIYS